MHPSPDCEVMLQPLSQEMTRKGGSIGTYCDHRNDCDGHGGGDTGLGTWERQQTLLGN